MEIIEYEERYLRQFRQLNLEWLDAYGLKESHDVEILDDPQTNILSGGGRLFLAEEDNNIIGSAALIKMHHGVYELAKMSVSPAFRGRGVGKILLEHCLHTAKRLGAEKIILFSSSKLTAAISMYEKYCFKHIPVIDTPFVTADVKMELSL